MDKKCLSPFLPSHPSVIDAMLGTAEIIHGERLYDLGAGTGRVVVMAASPPYYAKAVGIEENERLVSVAEGIIKSLNLQKRAEIVHANIFDYSYNDADVIFTYLTLQGMRILKPKLENELKERARVVSHDYEIEGWKPSKILEGIAPISGCCIHKKTKVFLYKMNKVF
jgi:precorrin-6B methylase 2